PDNSLLPRNARLDVLPQANVEPSASGKPAKAIFLAICFLTTVRRRVRQCNTSSERRDFPRVSTAAVIRRSKLCLAHLLVYLTALVGGTLHHHAHELTSP